MKILILEDDVRRQAAMRSRLAERFTMYPVLVIENAPAMIAYLTEHWREVLCLCLDHDLGLCQSANEEWTDHGTGRDVVEMLAQRAAAFPVILHTTNSAAGDGMDCRLQESGWKVQRVHPFGDLEWIDQSWFPVVRRAITGTARAQERSVSSG